MILSVSLFFCLLIPFIVLILVSGFTNGLSYLIGLGLSFIVSMILARILWQKNVLNTSNIVMVLVGSLVMTILVWFSPNIHAQYYRMRFMRNIQTPLQLVETEINRGVGGIGVGWGKYIQSEYDVDDSDLVLLEKELQVILQEKFNWANVESESRIVYSCNFPIPDHSIRFWGSRTHQLIVHSNNQLSVKLYFQPNHIKPQEPIC